MGKKKDKGAGQDYLYIGDGSDNTVKTFDAVTGRFLGTFISAGTRGLNGLRGLLFDQMGNLLVSNQNVNSEQNGNVLKYSGQNGRFLGEVVRSDAEGAPFAPRGIVLSRYNVLFVADFLSLNDQPGEIRAYDGNTGEFLNTLDHSGFSGPFHPRGVVVGPDGLLYVSVRALDELSGWVLRFNPVTGVFLDVFIESNAVNQLHRPEGLVFGPDGHLYITSFRADESDTDKILIFDGHTGEYLDKIDLYTSGQPRAFAQAILFGPDGKLYVPITGGDGPDTGSVRSYNIHNKAFKVLVLPAKMGGPLGEPWYLTFGNTNPTTLAYRGKKKGKSKLDRVPFMPTIHGEAESYSPNPHVPQLLYSDDSYDATDRKDVQGGPILE